MADGFLPPVVARLVADTKEFSAGMAEAEAKVAKMTGNSSTAFNKMATVGKAALFGLGTAAIGLGTEAIHLADTWEKSHARLTAAVKASGTAMSSIAPQISKLDKSFEKYGQTNAQTEAALARLTQATNDPKKALKEMGLVANIAAARHIDLEAAATLVGKVMQGNTTVLKRMGIDLGLVNGGLLQQKNAQASMIKADVAAAEFLKKHSDALNVNSKFHDEYVKKLAASKAAADKYHATLGAGATALDALSARFGGSAAAQAETFAGKLAALKARSEDLGKNIGLLLIPVLERVATVTLSVIQWFEKHRTVAIALGIAVGTVLVAAIGAYVASLTVAIAETLLAAAPIIGLLAPIAALGVGIYELATHWHQVWSDIKQWTGDAVAFLKDHLAIVFAITGPLGVVITEVAAHWGAAWGAIKTVVTDAWHVIDAIFQQIKRGVQDLISAIDKVQNLGKNPLVKGGLSAIPGVGTVLSLLPHLAEGGPVKGPAGAPVPIIAHAGEFVLSRRMLAGLSAGGAAMVSAGGGTTVHMTVVGSPGMDVGALAEAVRVKLLRSPTARTQGAAGLFTRSGS